MTRLIPFVAISALAIGCGPGPRHTGDDTGAPDAETTSCTPTAQTESSCNDGFDNDCNHFVDCEDTACQGTPECPVQPCEIQTPSVSFPLPDGNCSGIAPPPGSSDAVMQAYLDTCGAYDGVMNLTGFPAGARLDDTTKLIAI